MSLGDTFWNAVVGGIGGLAGTIVTSLFNIFVLPGLQILGRAFGLVFP